MNRIDPDSFNPVIKTRAHANELRRCIAAEGGKYFKPTILWYWKHDARRVGPVLRLNSGLSHEIFWLRQIGAED